MKTMTIIAATVYATALMAQDKAPELSEQEDEASANWRFTVGGFGRGNVRTKLKGTTADHERFWGADMDLQYNVWQNEDFNMWLGIGGTFSPNQDAYSNRGRSYSSEHQVSDDGYVTYDFDYSSRDRRSVDIGYGEFRLMAVPEWKINDKFLIGARMGVAFDWMRASCRRDSSWAWRSSVLIAIPGLPESVDTDSDSGRTSDHDAVTVFSTQAILGLQATYMFTDWLGIYAACDWRLGGDSTFMTDYGDKFSIDMSGWYAGTGIVVQF